MIHEGNTGIIRKMAREAYQLNPQEIQEKLSPIPNWPATRIVRRIVPSVEACKKLTKLELAELVYMGFVLMIETMEMAWYPVRTWDFMTGFSSDADVEIAKHDVEIARILKGSDAPLEKML